MSVKDLIPTRNLGKTGLGLAYWSQWARGAGKANNEKLAVAMIRRALELGVNYFDTTGFRGDQAME
jgi:aryl-alcohol dehydrogenase-like predicted oxidoreductase